jgi:RNA polymerase sigma factor (sigma-70 family)
MGRLATVVWERLYPFVFRITLDRDATEDILQDTLLAMICRLPSLRDNGRFWPWMYRIARSKIQDRLRSRRVRSSVEAVVSHAGIAANEQPEHPETVLDAPIREETLRQVSRAVAQLNRRYRDILHLRYYEQLPYTEIASLTRTTPERARVRSHRAKKTLKARLACCL